MSPVRVSVEYYCACKHTCVQIQIYGVGVPLTSTGRLMHLTRVLRGECKGHRNEVSCWYKLKKCCISLLTLPQCSLSVASDVPLVQVSVCWMIPNVVMRQHPEQKHDWIFYCAIFLIFNFFGLNVSHLCSTAALVWSWPHIFCSWHLQCPVELMEI